MKYFLTSLALLFNSSISFCQNYISITQTQVNQTQINQFNNYNSGLVYATNAFVNVYKDMKREKSARDEALAKLNIILQKYNSYNAYPETISDGWHSVVVTDNLKFCRDAKVLVENNKIQEFVIDNCFRLNFTSTGEIKKGKNVVTLNRFNGEQLEIADVFFLYDMEEPMIVPPPLNPGYICLWASKKKFVGERILIDEIPFSDGVSKTFIQTPKCDEKGTVTLMLKPGEYKLRIMKAGNDLDDIFEIKADECLMYKME